MFNIGPTELLLILVLALIVFGPNRLPEVARGVGRGLREFRRASDDLKDELQRGFNLDGGDDDEPFESGTDSTTGTLPTTPIPATPASGTLADSETDSGKAEVDETAESAADRTSE